jgi:hypothetical protein
MVLALLSTGALAGPQYVDTTGFAVSGYDVVAYFDLPPGSNPVLGHADITADHNGATFAFASEGNRDRFLADPDRFAPQYDGHCAYGVAGGYKVPANPTNWHIEDGKLYLNINGRIARRWVSDIPLYETQAADAWPTLEPAPASTDPVPWFRADGPVQD